MTKRFVNVGDDIFQYGEWYCSAKGEHCADVIATALNQYEDENKQLKSELKRCKNWLNSDKYDYQTTLAFIKSKGYSLKDVLEYEKKRN